VLTSSPAWAMRVTANSGRDNTARGSFEILEGLPLQSGRPLLLPGRPMDYSSKQSIKTVGLSVRKQ
jgi:hypothetical protein